jgi:hypothetical protein
VAKDQLEELVAGFNRLNQFGEASGRQVATLRRQGRRGAGGVRGARPRSSRRSPASRFAALAERSAAFRAELDGREVEAFAAIRRRAGALHEELESRRHDSRTAEESAIEALQSRLAQLRDEGTRIAETLRTSENDAAEAWSAAVSVSKSGWSRRSGASPKSTSMPWRRPASACRRSARRSSAATRRCSSAPTPSTRSSSAAMPKRASARRRTSRRSGDGAAAFDAQVVERQQEHLAHVRRPCRAWRCHGRAAHRR